MNTGKAHGAALGAAEVAAVKEILGFDPDRSFQVDAAVIDAHPQGRWTAARRPGPSGSRSSTPGRAANPEHKALFDRLHRPGAARRLGRRAAVLGRRPEGHRHPGGVRRRCWPRWRRCCRSCGAGRPTWPSRTTPPWPAPTRSARSTRRPSTGTRNPYGRTLHFGIREHAMGAILSGIVMHGPTRPYGGTFLQFSDYMRGAVRLASLMGAPAIYVWTHDSIGLGEDGPTHQPVEHLAALRAIPGLSDRPAGRRQRDRLRLAGHPGAPARLVLRPGRPVPDPAGRAGAGGHLRRGGAPAAATCWPSADGDAAGDPAGLRLRGADRRRRPGGAAGRGHRRPGGVGAVPGLVRRPGRRRTSNRCCRRR